MPDWDPCSAVAVSGRHVYVFSGVLRCYDTESGSWKHLGDGCPPCVFAVCISPEHFVLVQKDCNCYRIDIYESGNLFWCEDILSLPVSSGCGMNNGNAFVVDETGKAFLFDFAIGKAEKMELSLPQGLVVESCLEIPCFCLDR